jgi:hypothetical protein
VTDKLDNEQHWWEGILLPHASAFDGGSGGEMRKDDGREDESSLKGKRFPKDFVFVVANLQ